MKQYTVTFCITVPEGTDLLQAQILAKLRPDAPCGGKCKVLEVCKANGLQYYYGADKMAYTSCFLL